MAAKPLRLPRPRGWRCLRGSYFKAAFLSNRRKAAKLLGNGFPGRWKRAKKGGACCCFPPFPPRFCSQGGQRAFGGSPSPGVLPAAPPPGAPRGQNQTEGTAQSARAESPNPSNPTAKTKRPQNASPNPPFSPPHRQKFSPGLRWKEEQQVESPNLHPGAAATRLGWLSGKKWGGGRKKKGGVQAKNAYMLPANRPAVTAALRGRVTRGWPCPPHHRLHPAPTPL